MEKRHRKMIEDVVNESLTAIADSAARHIMNSAPVPWDVYEEKLVADMIEVWSDICAEKMAKDMRINPVRRFVNWLNK